MIICGFGRTGRHIARLLREEGFSFVALDLDPTQIKEAWEAGERVFYGDATQAHMLEAAGLKRARALVISFDDLQSALKVLQVHEAGPDLGVLVRARDDASLEQLLGAGATEGVPETFEASLMLAFRLLLLLEIPVGTIMRRIRAVHGSQYQLLQGMFREVAPGRDEAAAARTPAQRHTARWRIRGRTSLEGPGSQARRRHCHRAAPRGDAA